MENREIIIPSSFQLVPFYKENDRITVPKDISFQEKLDSNYFLVDILSLIDQDAVKPWENREHYIPIVFERWKEVKEQLNEIYKQRKRKQARLIMLQQISVWISSLFWINKRPLEDLYNWRKESDNLSYKPVNLEERLTFILDGPDHYHSFIQLSELFVELEKLYVKVLLKQD